MMRAATFVLLAGLAGVALAGGDQAQPAYSGAELYRTYCKTCHGAAGKGDGTLASRLRVAPPDLTLLAKHAGGTFPAAKVQRMIDGRDPVKGHGGPDMPVWGEVFAADPFNDRLEVRMKVRRLADHVRRIQEAGD